MWADERDPSFSLDMMEILQGLQEEVTHALKAKVAKTDIPGYVPKPGLAVIRTS